MFYFLFLWLNGLVYGMDLIIDFGLDIAPLSASHPCGALLTHSRNARIMLPLFSLALLHPTS